MKLGLGKINTLKNFILLFSMIPLILSMGIAPALPFVDASVDSESKCRE